MDNPLAPIKRSSPPAPPAPRAPEPVPATPATPSHGVVPAAQPRGPLEPVGKPVRSRPKKAQSRSHRLWRWGLYVYAFGIGAYVLVEIVAYLIIGPNPLDTSRQNLATIKTIEDHILSDEFRRHFDDVVGRIKPAAEAQHKPQPAYRDRRMSSSGWAVPGTAENGGNPEKLSSITYYGNSGPPLYGPLYCDDECVALRFTVTVKTLDIPFQLSIQMRHESGASEAADGARPYITGPCTFLVVVRGASVDASYTGRAGHWKFAICRDAAGRISPQREITRIPNSRFVFSWNPGDQLLTQANGLRFLRQQLLGNNGCGYNDARPVCDYKLDVLTGKPKPNL